MPTIYYRGTRADVKRIILQAIRIAAGADVDTLAVRQAVQYRMGNALLSKVQQAFVVKSRHGTDEAGIKWKELAESTLQARRRKAGLGTERQIKEKMRDASRRLTGGRTDKARERARATMRRLRKQQDAVANLSDNVEILRDTGLMLRSFSPGIDAAPSGAAFQVLDADAGRVIVGTNRHPWHHTGGKNLPARPLWPPDGRLPATWWDAITRAGVRGFAAVLAQAFSQNYRPAV